MYERQLLRELESLRPDVATSNSKVTPKTNGIPKPMIIPPLEDDSKPSPVPAVPNPSLNRGLVPTPIIPPSAVSRRTSVSQAPVPPQSPSAGSSKPPVASPQPPRPHSSHKKSLQTRHQPKHVALNHRLVDVSSMGRSPCSYSHRRRHSHLRKLRALDFPRLCRGRPTPIHF